MSIAEWFGVKCLEEVYPKFIFNAKVHFSEKFTKIK